MKLSMQLALAATLAMALSTPMVFAQADAHRMVRAAELKWSPVPSLPAGALITVIEGPMNEAVPFTVRLKFPANYRVPAHWHPAVERVTVLSGEFYMGVGDRYDESKSHGMGVGDFMVMQPKLPHFAFTKVATEVQLHGTGPWGVTYVNPDDDPRKK
jgi:quercetin dioxygenase-like cupin family protein